MNTPLLKKQIEAFEEFISNYEISSTTKEFYYDIVNEYHCFILEYKGSKLELKKEIFRALLLSIEGIEITKRRDSEVINITISI